MVSSKHFPMGSICFEYLEVQFWSFFLSGNDIDIELVLKIQSGLRYSIISSWQVIAMNFLLELLIALCTQSDPIFAICLSTTDVNSSNTIGLSSDKRALAKSTLIFSPLLNTLYGLSQDVVVPKPTDTNVLTISSVLDGARSSITLFSKYNFSLNLPHSS